jgi:hypothetical protein
MEATSIRPFLGEVPADLVPTSTPPNHSISARREIPVQLVMPPNSNYNDIERKLAHIVATRVATK